MYEEEDYELRFMRLEEKIDKQAQTIKDLEKEINDLLLRNPALGGNPRRAPYLPRKIRKN